MAEATFTLRAVDATKQAFASVQNNLSKIHKTSMLVATTVRKFLVIGLVISAFTKLAQAIQAVSRGSGTFGLNAAEVEHFAAALAMVSKFLGSIAGFGMKVLEGVVASFARLFITLTSGFVTARTEMEKYNALLKKGAPVIAMAGEKTKQFRMQIDDLGKSEGFLFLQTKARIDLLRKEQRLLAGIDPVGEAEKGAEIAELQFDNTKREIVLNNQLSAATFRLGEAQKKLFGEKLPLQERINDLAFQEAQIMIQMEGLAEDDLEGRAILRDKLANLMERTNSLLERQGMLGKQAGEMIAFGFEDAIFSGQKLSEVLKQLGLDLVRLVFSNLITQPLATGIGDFLKGVFRADGGPVGSGKPYIVGERGPELFVPGASGSIVPNDAMRGSGSGGTSVNITYHISSGVSRAELTPILETERRRLKAEIPDMVRRGGSYRAAFA